MAHDVTRAVAVRDAAAMRVRRTTAVVTAAGLGATVLFASLAAASTHLRKVVTRTRVPQRHQTTGPVSAPAPPLVAVNEPSTASPPPAPAPTPTQQTPVVVSGGS